MVFSFGGKCHKDVKSLGKLIGLMAVHTCACITTTVYKNACTHIWGMNYQL